MKIINGKKIRDEILAKVKNEVAILPFKPIFCDILVGNNKVSMQYVKMKAKIAESIGIKFHNAFFSSEISKENLIKEIKKLNKIKNMCGIIVQLPLPKHLDKHIILDAINFNLDVDCLGIKASTEFYKNYKEKNIGFPTALACMKILDFINLNLNGKKIVVLGQGDLVGKPVTALLKFRGLNPNIITSKTENKEKIIKEADLRISGIGQGKYITADKVKNGVILIDAGTSESNGGIIGDVDLESVKNVASYVSPVPGGVGPVTVAMLLNNVLQVAKNKNL